jgi:hypothetical protein
MTGTDVAAGASTSTSDRRGRLLEKWLSGLALGFSAAVTTWLWIAVASRQPMWPFPGGYFVEVVLLPGLVALLVWRGNTGRTRAGFAVTGAITAFCVLGAWSVGLFYVPLAILLLVGAIAGGSSTRESAAAQAGYLVGGFVLQAGAMLALVRLPGI